MQFFLRVRPVVPVRPGPIHRPVVPVRPDGYLAMTAFMGFELPAIVMRIPHIRNIVPTAITTSAVFLLDVLICWSGWHVLVPARNAPKMIASVARRTTNTPSVIICSVYHSATFRLIPEGEHEDDDDDDTGRHCARREWKQTRGTEPVHKSTEQSADRVTDVIRDITTDRRDQKPGANATGRPRRDRFLVLANPTQRTRCFRDVFPTDHGSCNIITRLDCSDPNAFQGTARELGRRTPKTSYGTGHNLLYRLGIVQCFIPAGVWWDIKTQRVDRWVFLVFLVFLLFLFFDD